MIAGGGVTGGGTPSVSQRAELSLAMEDEVEAVLSSFTLSGLAVPPGFVAAGCPTAGPTGGDADGDGIPTNQTLTFTNPPCTVTGLRPGTLGVTGTVRIQDTTATDNVSYLLTFTNLAWTAVDTAGGSRSYTATRNGTRSRTATDSSTVLNSSITIARLRPGLANTTITLTSLAELVTFTDSLAISGNLHWRRSTENWDLAIDTPIRLVFDNSCTTTPQRIRSGVLTLTGAISGAAGVLSLTFTGCGVDPTRTWTATP